MTGFGRILYVGGLTPGGNGQDWLTAIQLSGAAVIPFDTKSYRADLSLVERKIGHKLKIAPYLTRLNRDLRNLTRQVDYDAAFVMKGVDISPQSVSEIKKNSKRKFVMHLTLDALFGVNRSRLFTNALSLYDICFTDKRFEIPEYELRGAAQVWSFDQPFGLRFEDREAIREAQLRVPRSDVLFVGRCEPHYVRTLREISTLPISLHIWGPGWKSYANKNRWALEHVQGNGLWGAEYPAALANTKLGIGLLSKLLPEESTTRTVEIPAAGAMLLAERTERHELLFREGVEAEFYADFGEMKQKIMNYVNNDGERKKVAEMGRIKAIRCYNMRDTVNRIMSIAGIG